MALKNIESDFRNPVLHIEGKSMEEPPFAEISRRLGFIAEVHIEKEAYEALIEFPGESNISVSTLMDRWHNVLTEIAATRINDNYVLPATISITVQEPGGGTSEKQIDIYAVDPENAKPYMVITTAKGRFDFLNGTPQ